MFSAPCIGVWEGTLPSKACVCFSTKWLLADELVIHRVRSWSGGQCGIFNLIIICNRNAIIPVWRLLNKVLRIIVWGK